MDVSAADEFKSVKRTTDQTAGATLLTATGSGVLFNISTGQVKPPSGTVYWSADARLRRDADAGPDRQLRPE